MHYRRFIRPAAVILCVAALAGCKSKGPEAGKKEKTGQVIAEVNGATITTDDFKEGGSRTPSLSEADGRDARRTKEMLDSMVVRELVLQDAQKQGIDKSPEVAAKIEDMKKRVVVETYLKKKVEEQAKISDADLQKSTSRKRISSKPMRRSAPAIFW